MINDIQGVYSIVNIINNKIYIGSSIHVNKRFSEHKYSLGNNCHYNKHLQNAWNKYGEENFSFSIVEQVDGDESILKAAEQKWIDYYESYKLDKGYNVDRYVSGKCRIVSEETKEKIRMKHIGKKASEETKRKFSSQRKGKLNAFYGRTHTIEAREKMRKAKLGVKASDAQRLALAKFGGVKSYT